MTSSNINGIKFDSHSEYENMFEGNNGLNENQPNTKYDNINPSHLKHPKDSSFKSWTHRKKQGIVNLLFQNNNKIDRNVLSEKDLSHFLDVSLGKKEVNGDISNKLGPEIKHLLKNSDDPVFKSYVQNVPKIQMYKDILLQGFFVPHKLLKGLENVYIREDDIIISSYPKSGTTWTEEVVSGLYNNGDIEKIKDSNIIYRVIHLEVGRPFFPITFLNNLKSPRLLATHLPFNLLPKQVREKKCKIINIARNPKDNAVSYFHHHQMASFLGNYKGSWSDFLHLFGQGKIVYGSWFDHVIPYWEEHKKHPDKILFLKYEDMKKDLEKEIVRIMDFIGIHISPEARQTLIAHCSFENMKNNAMVNKEELPIRVFDLSFCKFMRKGVVGDWKNYFTPEQNGVFDEIYRAKMSTTDLKFDFEINDPPSFITTNGN